MKEPVSFRILDLSAATVAMRTRMPFHYGIASLEALPHVFLRARLEFADGTVSVGVAADGLLPKWFEKNRESTGQQDLRRMWEVIVGAGKRAETAGWCASVFSFWKELYQAQRSWASANEYPPLLWHFGVTMVERAVIDAVCRGLSVPIHRAFANGSLGFDITSIYPRLDTAFQAHVTNSPPLERINIRHTVGLSDPLVSTDVEKPLNDGLPETLEENVKAYELRYFKVKVRGDVEADLERLKNIFHLLENLGIEDYAFTLDGNEQFTSVDELRGFWESLCNERALASALKRLLFVEQPLARTVALSEDSGAALQRWLERPPLIIDESDAELESLPKAMGLGYAGTSHKNCKGVFKGVINRILLEEARSRNEGHSFIMSAEDLVNVGPVALLQDLAVAGYLGIAHVERNGHHYFRGLSMFSQELQREMVRVHNDLYTWDRNGFARLEISKGAVSLQSINRAPFGVSMIPEEARYVDIKDWSCPQMDS